MRTGILLFLCIAAAFAENPFQCTFTQQVQPSVIFSTDESAFELQRAILGFKPSLKKSNTTYTADFKLEFAGYDKLDKFVKKAMVSAEIQPWLTVSAGRVRVPFGENHVRASRKLDRVSRSHTASYIKKQLSIGERSEGLLLSGDLNEYLSYESGIFNYSNNRRESNSLSSLAGNSVLTVVGKPMKLITLGYSYNNFLVSNDLYYSRVSAHDLFLKIRSSEHFVFNMEYFAGPDSTVIADIAPSLNGFKEHIGKSLYATLTYNHKIEKRILGLTLFWERLWGSNPIDGGYENRRFDHALGANIRFRFQDYIYLDLEVEELLDQDVKSIGKPTVTLQFTYYNKRG